MSVLLYKLPQGYVELTQEDGRVTYPTPDGQQDCPCMYFANCDRDAVTTVPNPVVGDVPSCQRCADFAQGG